MFGYRSQDALGRNVDLIIPKQFHAGHQGKNDNTAEGGPACLDGTFAELTAQHADGRQFSVEISLAQWGDADVEGGFAAIVRDVSLRQALQNDRRHARQFLDTIVTNLP